MMMEMILFRIEIILCGEWNRLYHSVVDNMNVIDVVILLFKFPLPLLLLLVLLLQSSST